MIIEFFEPIKKLPTATAQEKRVKEVTKNDGSKKIIFYDPVAVKKAKLLFLNVLGKHSPKNKLSGAISLKVMWLYRTTKPNLNGAFKLSKPDTDNLQKLLKDCMTQCGYWDDDAQVVVEHIEKRWAMLPGLFIRVQELENDNN